MIVLYKEFKNLKKEILKGIELCVKEILKV